MLRPGPEWSNSVIQLLAKFKQSFVQLLLENFVKIKRNLTLANLQDRKSIGASGSA